MMIKKKNTKEENILDEELIEYVQPRGGITFREANYITCGDGYVRVLHIYQLPKILDDFWLDKIINIPDTIATIDINTRDVAEVKKNINKSLKEEYSRERGAKDYMEVYDARQRQEELETMLHELSSMGEMAKMLDFRIYVKGRNLVDLDDKCDSIIKSLEGDSYMATTLLNEGKREWESLFEPYNTQHSKPFYMNAIPLITEQVAIGYPFDYSELIDPHGDLVGFTPMDGVVVFNEFTKTAARKHYNSLVCGDMGSGKSTLLKKRFKANAALGNFIRVFDVTGEFEGLVKEFGGKIIKCNGEEGILNPLEILEAGDDDFSSYARHITKVSTFFKCLIPSITDQTVLLLENNLREFYQSYNLVPKEGTSITGLPAKNYPIFSDFYKYLEKEIEELKHEQGNSEVEIDLLKVKARGLNEIMEAVKNIVTNYGNMFDGHTTVDNIIDEKIVSFDISSIKDLGNVFVAQMFNMVSLCWDNAINNGKIMKQMYETGELSAGDVTKFLILIDESHRWVNTKMPMILDLLIKYLREARKYFAGITFASQSVRDFMPEGGGSENVNLIKTLFELTQYKFMFRQDSSTVKMLNDIFNNALSYSQIDQIPYLNTGEAILSIAGDRSLRFNVWLSNDYEKQLFSGGM